jgi:NADH-quinone oxidoreductase subunit L
MHTNDIWKMGGLSRQLPITFLTFTAGVFALAGVWPLAGFFSKDEILHAAAASGHWGVAAVLLLTAGLTAYYMTRVWVLAFFGQPRDPERYRHAHESPASMAVPLIALAIPAVCLGFLSHWTHGFEKLVPAHLEHEGHAVSSLAVGLASSAAALAGIGLGWLVYRMRIVNYEGLSRKFWFVWKFLYARMGFDHFWLACVAAADRVAAGLARFDYEVLDQGLVDAFGRVTDLASRLWGWFDDVVVDGLVDLWGSATVAASRGARAAVAGYVQSYLLYMALGLSFMLCLALYFKVG